MKSWKTTLMGVVLAAMIAIQPLTSDELNLEKDWPKFALAIAIAIFGYFSKDHDVTGK
jgi:hypothetical protein